MLLVAFIACQTLPPTGKPFQPAPAPSTSGTSARPVPAGARPDAAGEANQGTADGFDFEADAEEIQGDSLPDDPAAILAMQHGLEPPPPSTERMPSASASAPSEPVEELAIPAMPMQTAPADWGLRLVSTLHNVQPPRAILGLPDGSEAVVTAGSMLPDQNAVVMAIGHQQIEVAWISGAGYQARIETERITALYPE